jgi:type IV secretory pathway TraG/TraD family ATPase VirD4
LAHGGVTLYIEIPPSLWRSHGLLARLWLSALLQLAAAKTSPQPMLFFIDSIASPTLLPQLLTAQRLPAGRVEVWSFWESLEQMRVRHPADWSAFLGGCRTVQAAGSQSPPVAAELASAFGASVVELARLAPSGSVTLWGVGPDEKLADVVPDAISGGAAGHVVTFAPSQASKWGKAAAAIVERKNSSVVVLESAGRCHALTAAKRASIGQVVRLDPFGVLSEPGDQFNPLDLLQIKELAGTVDPLLFAEWLMPQEPSNLDPYWRTATISFLQGLLGYLAVAPGKQCNVSELRNILSESDVVYNLAKVIDDIGKQLPKESRHLISLFLQKADNERTSLIATASQALRVFGDPRTAAQVEKTSFDLRSLMSGNVMTIYIEMPTFRSLSHNLLVHLWVSSLLTLSNTTSACNTMFVLDSPVAPSLFPALNAVQSSLRCEMWTFWESLNQLRAGQPTEWSTFLANAQRVEAIGPQGPVVAGELAAVFGHSIETIQSLPPGESLVLHEYPSR